MVNAREEFIKKLNKLLKDVDEFYQKSQEKPLSSKEATKAKNKIMDVIDLFYTKGDKFQQAVGEIILLGIALNDEDFVKELGTKMLKLLFISAALLSKVDERLEQQTKFQEKLRKVADKFGDKISSSEAEGRIKQVFPLLKGEHREELVHLRTAMELVINVLETVSA